MHAPRTITLSDGNWTKKMRYIPGTGDQFVVKEVLIDEIYNFDFNKNDIVLNLGGNIGAFDVFAYDRVKCIVTYEPDPKAFSELQWHLKENNITNVMAYNEAIAPHNGNVALFRNGESGHNSCVEKDGLAIDVPCKSLEYVLSTVDYTKIKCDIEGFEYAIFDGITIPERVNEIWFETHTFSPEQHKQHENLCKDLEEQGFIISVFKNDEQDRTFLVRAKR